MKISTDRILTTHVGSLPRPKPLFELHRREGAGAVDDAAFEARVARAPSTTWWRSRSPPASTS